MIAEDLRGFATPVDELKHHPDNPRKGDVKAIVRSLERFGQVRPIVALRDGTVVAGNHVLRAARDELGWEEIAAVRVDLPEDEARAYLLADNRLSELGTYADEALASLLERVVASGNIDGTGYGEDEVAKLIKKLRPPAPDEFPSFSEGSIDTTYECESCGYQWS